MRGLEKYKVPDLVKLKLEDTDAVFLVQLPTRWNKAYTRDWQDYLAESTVVNEEGKMKVGKVNPREMLEHQQRAFINHCVKEYPDGVDAEMMLEEYLPATESLFAVAQQLASEEEARADALSKKQLTSSTGKTDGEVSSASTKSLKKPIELHPTTESPIREAQIG